MSEIIKEYTENINGVDYLFKEYSSGAVVKEPIFHFSESYEQVELEPTQLDRIESMISKSQEQIKQEARDAYTLELINSGII